MSKEKYVPGSNIVASDDPQIFLNQQVYVVQQVNDIRDIHAPELTLVEYQKLNGLKS